MSGILVGLAPPAARALSRSRAADRGLLAGAALLFTGSAALTAYLCAPMSEMGGMRMPGGWTLSMAWMRMPGQTWTMVAASFLGMWVVMMVAMMLPSLVPMLMRYRRAVDMDEPELTRRTLLVGTAYFVVWTLLGMLVFPLGDALAATAMRHAVFARAIPLGSGLVVLLAGALQLTPWKARHLGCCRMSPVRGWLPPDPGTAWRHGLRLGLHCCHCCAPLTAVLLVLGVMDLRAMGLVTAAITAERLAPAGERLAHVFGVAIAALGLLWIAWVAVLA
jgi:predicted metal-binding membrane protein